MSENEYIDPLSRKVIKVVGISAIIVLLILLILKGFKVLLLILAGLLFSIFFRGIALQLRKWFHINDSLSVAISFVGIVGLLVLGSFLAAPQLSSQMNELKQKIPEAAEHTKEQLKGTAVGDFLLSNMKGLSSSSVDLQKKAVNFFSTVFGVFGDIYIIFFLGVFFMVQPKIYRESIVSLFPKPKRDKAKQVLLTIAYNLKRWLLGKLLSMLVVGIFTIIGLKFLSIPMAFTLGIFAGIVTFIPNFGPLISFIPAGLLALVQGTDTLLYVAVLYVGIQALESNLITPFIQRSMISFPMAAILIAQVFLGVLTGALGVILAVPVVVVLVVLVKMLYIEGVLQDKEVEVKGEDKF